MANSLLVKLGFDVDNGSVTGTISGIGRITSALDGLRRAANVASVGAGIKNIASSVKSVASSLSDQFKKSFDFAESFAASGDKIAKTSRLVGLSVKDYQAFSSAAQHAGMSTEEMDNALKRFNVELGKARGGDKTALKGFDAILGGKSLSSFKDSTSLLKEIANGYSKLATAEQKAFVTQELFGRGGVKMSELLSNGEDGINKLIADFEDHGGGFSEEGAKNAEAFDDALQDVRETVNSLKISVAQELFPTFIDLFKTVQDFVKDNREELVPVVREIFGRVAEFVKSLLPKIPTILNTILSIINGIGPDVVVTVAAVMPLLPAVGQMLFGLYQMLPLIKGIFGVIQFIATYGHGLVVGVKLLAALIGGPTLATIGLVVAAVVSWGIAIKSIYDNWNLVGDAVEWVWTTIKESIEWWWNGFKSLFVDPVWNFFQALPGAISSLIDGFLDGFKTIGQMVYELGGKIYDTIVGSVKDAWSAAKGVLSNIPFVGKLFDDSKSSDASSSSSLGASVAQAVSESHTTTTSRFAVDFKNMPRGVQVTAPDHGDFDYSRGYVLAGM